jgi:hypothetical protein
MLRRAKSRKREAALLLLRDAMEIATLELKIARAFRIAHHEKIEPGTFCAAGDLLQHAVRG